MGPINEKIHDPGPVTERKPISFTPLKVLTRYSPPSPQSLSYYCRSLETDHLQLPCDDCRNQLQGLETWQDAATTPPRKQTKQPQTNKPLVPESKPQNLTPPNNSSLSVFPSPQ